MLSKVVSSSIFKVFGMTRPGIEPRSPGPLANTLTAGPMSAPLHIGVVAIEKGAFGLPSTMVANFTFTYIYIYIGSICSLIHIWLNIRYIFYLHIFLFILNYPIGKTYKALFWYKFRSIAFRKHSCPTNSFRKHNNIWASK